MEPTTKQRLTVFAIAGYAGAGKDTLATAIAHYLPESMKCERVKMADELKEGIDQFLKYLGLPEVAFTEDREIKEKIRPLLVEAGKYARSQDEGVFANLVTGVLRGAENRGASVAFITDLRYLNEYQITFKACEENGWDMCAVYVVCNGVNAANDEEKKSIDALLSGSVIERAIFDLGDFNAIDAFARRTASILSQPK